MSRVPEENFCSNARATSMLFNSDRVNDILNSLDNLILTPGDLRRDESDLKLAHEVEKDGILRERQVADKLTADIKKLENENLKLIKEKHSTEIRTEEKRSVKIPCIEDEETLNKLSKTLTLYKDITNIRWDYSAPENLIKGYIYGIQKNYVHTFKIPSNEPDAVDRVWQEIENASLIVSNDSKEKENVCENKKV